MATRLKPSRINVDNTPRVGEGASYKTDDDFHWSMGGGDMAYEDFAWQTLTGSSITIEKISNNITPSGDFTVSAGTVKPGITYTLRVNSGNTPYTMTLGTGVTNPNGYATTLEANTVSQFRFIATSDSQLELELVDSSIKVELDQKLDHLVVLSYGSSTWNDFINAYNKNALVYCRASSNTDPSTGSQGRMAFMAYVNNATTPTEVEFQYYRSVATHTDSQQGDQVFVYKLTNASGGTWTVTTREASSKVAAGTGITKTYSSGTITIANDGVLTVNGSKGTVTVNDIKVAASAPSNPTAGVAWYDSTNNVLKVYNGTAWDTIATGGAISDTAYGSGWDGQTTTAPSQNAVYDKIELVEGEISTNTSAISTINGKIPSEATTSNQLADKEYVLDNINSVTAYYITKDAQGDQFATYAELAAATTFYSGGVARVPTRNDYTIVLADENHDDATTRYIYNSGWEYQYTINETPLTQAQLNALNSGITAAKVTTYDKLDTKVFNAINQTQDALDWYLAGKNPVLKYGDNTYFLKTTTSTKLTFQTYKIATSTASNQKTTIYQNTLTLNYSGTTAGTLTQAVEAIVQSVLLTDTDYSTPYTPQYNGSPTTKKYVDDRDTYIGSSAPTSNLVEGRLWYDTTNDQLKVYDGTNWQVTGKEYNAGPGISIGTYNDYSAMQGPCPNGFHIATQLEWESLKTLWTGLGQSGSGGADFLSNLKMPMAASRSNSTGTTTGGISTDTGYWSCTCKSTASYEAYAYAAYFTSGLIKMDAAFQRSYGFYIRPFKDVSVSPDNSWTVLLDGSGIATGAGIFHNSSLGLISISSNGTSRLTISDKNLGATTVYNTGDTASESNCGKQYQWGNNYGFQFSGSVTTSTTVVDATGYGPGNYYNSTTFINGSNYWDSSDNKNLRGGETGVVTIQNAISNTGVTSINGQTGDITFEGGVTSVNGQTGAVTVNEVPSTGTTGNVLTKTASGYEFAAPAAAGIISDPNSPTTITKLRAGSKYEFNNATKEEGVIYNVY